MEDTVAKKARVWNPAVDNDVIKDKLHSEQDQSANDVPVDFSRAPNPSLPFLLQNYFHMARVQQQRVVEEAIRRGFMPSFPMQTILPMAARSTPIPTLMPSSQTIASLMSSSVASSSAGPSISTNPLVQSALGVPSMSNENCCAICGSAFRLTADLVQHMRNNHRRTRFKRKNEKAFA